MLKQIEKEIIDSLEFGLLRFTLLKVDVGYKIKVRKTVQ